jgi:phosphoribosylformylglycinamidine cyclo-ligase
MKSDSYKAAGVDIDLAQKLLSGMKSKIAAARRPEMLAPVGGFGGLFELDLSKYKKPVIVSSVDGVGTKLMIAMMMNKFDSIGYDIVNHCINDIAVCGAEPLYFMDYIGIGKLRSPLYEEVLSGIADACKLAGCALLGGETAEMPGMYGEDFDLVGSITGVVEKENLITGEKIKPGHIAVGMASNGLHTNGYSLARHIVFEKCRYDVNTELKELNTTIGDALLKPHTCYWSAIDKVMQSKEVSLDGMAHITGGGLYDNVPRILPKTVNVEFNSSALPVPPIMKLINDAGNIEKSEAYRVFNMGIGMVLFVPESDADKTVEICRAAGYTTEICGKVSKGDGTVIVD